MVLKLNLAILANFSKTYGKISQSMSAEHKQATETGASSKVLGKIEKHYFEPKPRTDETIAVEDYTGYLEAKSTFMAYKEIMWAGEIEDNSKIMIRNFRNTDDNRKGEYGRKSVIAEYFAKSLEHAYITEGIPAAEAHNKVTDVFIGVRDRLQTPNTQSAQKIQVNTTPGK
jgi:hypothetical protein